MTVNAYPGNPSLPDEVKERVLTTFDQTLTLFDGAQLDEVVAGCDLILEMDERFEPAKLLRQKAKDPAAPIDMTPLYELRDSRGSSGAATGGGDAEAQVLQAVEALNNGNYEAAVQICNQVLASNPSHEEAQRIGQQANERLEAGPFVQQFLQEANEAIAAGNLDSARTLIEKAKSLDPLHPEIAAAAASLESAPAAPATGSSEGGSGFDFGGDASPFAAAFGAEESTPESGGGGAEAAPPEAPAEPGGFDFAAAAEEQPAAPVDFAAPAEEEPEASVDFAAPAEEESPAPVDFAAPAEEAAAPEAANFGFTLEEEPAADATPAAPEATPAAPEPAEPEASPGQAQTFDFSGGDVEITDDDQAKIDNYLKDGDNRFEAGDYQGAIDAWSKIFLIDVTNEQASERIEAAKEKKREADGRLDDLLATGIGAYEREDYTTAKQTFEEVLAQDPENFRAQEYLEKLADHAAATAAPPPPPAAESFEPEGDVYQGEMPAGDMYEPPPAPKAAPSPKPMPSPRPAAKKSPKMLIIGVVAVIALAVGGWFGWSMLSGGGDSESVDTSVTQGKITRAQVLAEGGDFAQAISILSSIEAGDPMRDQALQLIAQYKQQQAKSGGTVGGRPVTQVRNEMLARARDAFGREDYLEAKSEFEEAAKLKPLDQADREMYEAANRQVSKLDAAAALFAQGSYAEAIEEINSVLQSEPDNVNARQMLVKAHYNLGVLALRNRDLADAIAEFNYVLEQNPQDTMARRSMEIAQNYESTSIDLMYEIYVKYLPLR